MPGPITTPYQQAPITGPFSDVLTQPNIPPPQQQTQPSGFGGVGQAISMVADKFLQGFSQGRRRSFEQGELQKSRSISAIDYALQDVQNAPITDDAKQQEVSRLQKMKMQLVLGAAEGGDQGQQGGGQKKGKKGQQTDDQGHPVVGAIKNAFTKLVGPGAQPMPIDPKEILAQVGQTYAFLKDPANSVPEQMKQVDTQMLQVYADKKKELQGRNPVLADLSGDPRFQKAYTAGSNLTGGKGTPGMQMLMKQIQADEAEQSPTAVAQRTHLEAQGAELKARARLEDEEREGGGSLKYGKPQAGSDLNFETDRQGNPRDPSKTYVEVTGSKTGKSLGFDPIQTSQAKTGQSEAWAAWAQRHNTTVDKMTESDKEQAEKEHKANITPGTEGVRSTVGMDAQGRPVVNQLPYSRRLSGGTETPTTATPQTTPPRTAAPQTATPPGPNGARNIPRDRSGAPSRTDAPPGRTLAGMPPGVYNQAIQRVTPVREAANQLFGDPTQPGFKGLVDYAKIADNPEASKRVGTALRFTFDRMSEAEKASGGAMEFIRNTTGFSEAMANARRDAQQQVLSKLNPEELEAYNATLSAYATIVGLRSLSRASASQSSVRALENELPTIGDRTKSSKDFYDKLERLSEEVYTGYRTIPKGFLTPQEEDRMKELPNRIRSLKGGGSTTPPPAGKQTKGVTKKSAEDEAAEWLKKN